MTGIRGGDKHTVHIQQDGSIRLSNSRHIVRNKRILIRKVEMRRKEMGEGEVVGEVALRLLKAALKSRSGPN
jgi:hypothetical protein